MAGTSRNEHSSEFERVSNAESNNYYSGRTGSASEMKPGFGPKQRSAKDPNNTSANTDGPSAKK